MNALATPGAELSAAEVQSTDGRFIVGTGRCGSTLLSDLLSQHPSVLSLSEVFSGVFSGVCSLRPKLFPDEALTGAALWGVLGRPSVHPLVEGLSELLGVPCPEASGPSGADACGTAPVPAQLMSCVGACGTETEAVLPEIGAQIRSLANGPEVLVSLGSVAGTEPPRLMPSLRYVTSDPESLHEELAAHVRELPHAPLGTQYSRVFDWLAQRCGRWVWVERSALSTPFLPDFLRLWPDGRYVHLVRDGRAVAVSMSTCFGFSVSLLFRELRQRPDVSNAVEALVSAMLTSDPGRSVPIERFGELWAEQVVATQKRLSSLPPERRLLLRYEELTEAPERELRRLVDFLGVGGETTDDWIQQMAATIYSRPPAWLGLPASQRADLTAACEPGLRMLGYSS